MVACWASGIGRKGRPRGRVGWAFGPKQGGERVFSFSFLLFQSHFNTLFKNKLNYFEFCIKSLIKINKMQQHVCSNMLLPYDKFEFNENYYFPMFS